jgi:ligand-binding SRPBCC domain-containing protein
MRRARGRILRRQLIPLPLKEVTAYFEEPRNLQHLTPPWLGFHILEVPPGPVERGSAIRYRLRLFGIPMGWLTHIERSDPGWGFVDTQIEGPYASWVHTHLFSHRPEGVLMEDRVDYELPFGPLGFLAAPFIRVQLAAIFRYRRRTVQDLRLP